MLLRSAHLDVLLHILTFICVITYKSVVNSGMLFQQTSSFTNLLHSCQEEKDKWLEDMQRCIADAKERGGDQPKIQYPSLKSNSML